MSMYGVNEMASDWAKEINKITVVEGTNDDYGVDDTLAGKGGFYKTYVIDEDGRLLSVTLSVFAKGYLVCINTNTQTITVSDGPTNTATRDISSTACSKINEYYCPSFARY